jgi:GAF domain-containing protein
VAAAIEEVFERDEPITAQTDLVTKAGERIPHEFTGAKLRAPDGTVLGLVGVGRDITEQKELERQLRALQRTARELIVAEDEQEIATLAVEAAEDGIGLPITSLWEYDEATKRLEPIAETAASEEMFDGTPVFEHGEGLAWRAFESSEFLVFEDVQSEPERANPDTELRGEMLAPLGDHGVMASGSTETGAFSERDVELFRILAASVEAALLRADRERKLRTREQELPRQNERLDEFASVVAHDLRNPLAVASGYLDLARENGDPEDFDRIEDALERIDRLIDGLLMLARGGETVGDTEAVSLETIAESAGTTLRHTTRPWSWRRT